MSPVAAQHARIRGAAQVEGDPAACAEEALRLGRGAALRLLAELEPERRAMMLLASADGSAGAGTGDDRAAWQIFLAAEHGAENALANHVTARFEGEDDPVRLRCQADVLAELALGGRDHARELLLRRFSRQDFDDPELFAAAMVRAGGVEGFIFAAEVLGQRVEKEPGFAIGGTLDRAARARLGAADVRRRMERRAERGTPMLHYMRALDARPDGGAAAAEAGKPRAAGLPEPVEEAPDDAISAASSAARAAARAVLLVREGMHVVEDVAFERGPVRLRVHRLRRSGEAALADASLAALAADAARAADDDETADPIRALRRTARCLRLALFDAWEEEGHEPSVPEALEALDLITANVEPGCEVRLCVSPHRHARRWICLASDRRRATVLRLEPAF